MRMPTIKNYIFRHMKIPLLKQLFRVAGGLHDLFEDQLLGNDFFAVFFQEESRKRSESVKVLLYFKNKELDFFYCVDHLRNSSAEIPKSIWFFDHS